MKESVKKYSFIFFAVALLFPSLLNLTHVFAHQEQETCSNFTETHYHKKSLNCELCDLRINQVLAFEAINYQIYIPFIPALDSIDYYQFSIEYQKLSFALRGPPALPTA